MTKSQANYDQDKKKENISVSKAQNNQNASSSANRAKNTKSAYKEETKSINDIVSKELSVISDEVYYFYIIISVCLASTMCAIKFIL